MADPYANLPADFMIPGFPRGVNLPNEMRAYWLARIEANTEVVKELPQRINQIEREQIKKAEQGGADNA